MLPTWPCSFLVKGQGHFLGAGACTMLLPETEFRRLQRVVYNGLTNVDLLTDFDRKFLMDYEKKFDQYKRHTFVSDGQNFQFDRIEKYLKEELGADYEYD
jgi:hypothetical protein